MLRYHLPALTHAARIGAATVAAAGLIPGAAAFAQCPGAAKYHQVRKIPIGGEGGWDYLTVDSGAHRLYVTRGSHVTVIDTDRDAVVGDIKGLQGVHGVAVAPELNRGYISDGRANTVVVFDLRRLTELKRIPVGTNPDAILYDRASKRVFTFNGGSSDVTAVDAVSGAVVGTIPVGGKPEFCVNDGRGSVFCNIEDKNEIVAFESRTLKIRRRSSIAPVEEPSGLAFDVTHHRLFAVGGNKMMAVVDSDTGKLVATPAIGEGPDAAAFDPVTGLAISSNGRDGTMTLVREESPTRFRVVGTVPTQTGARTMALDPRTHKIYLITAKFKAPAPGAPGGRRPAMEPNSAVILVYAP